MNSTPSPTSDVFSIQDETATIQIIAQTSLQFLQICVVGAVCKKFVTERWTCCETEEEAKNVLASEKCDGVFATIVMIALCVFIQSAGWIFGTSSIIIQRKDFTQNYCIVWNAINLGVVLISRVFLHSFYFYRVRQVFQDTILHVHPYFSISFGIFAVSWAVTSVCVAIASALLKTDVRMTIPNGRYTYCAIAPHEDKISMSLTAVFVLMDLAVITSCTCLFLCKLQYLQQVQNSGPPRSMYTELMSLSLRTVTLFLVTIGVTIGTGFGAVLIPSDNTFGAILLVTCNSIVASCCVYANFRWGIRLYNGTCRAVEKMCVVPCLWCCHGCGRQTKAQNKMAKVVDVEVRTIRIGSTSATITTPRSP